MVFIEPPAIYELRIAAQQQRVQSCSQGTSGDLVESAPLTAFNTPKIYEDGWDEWVVHFLMGHPSMPVRIVSLVSELRKQVRHRSRRHREKIKQDILHRITALIRAGVILRIDRKFLVLPGR
jgi:hypothetical protein